MLLKRLILSKFMQICLVGGAPLRLVYGLLSICVARVRPDAPRPLLAAFPTIFNLGDLTTSLNSRQARLYLRE